MMDIELNEIVLVSDSVNHNNISINSNDLEKPSIEYEQSLNEILLRYFKKVNICKTPKELAEMLRTKNIDIVLTIYGGEISRNRMSLIPAICESYNIPFMGADVYARTICQDKDLSKKIVSNLGIETPSSILINNDTEIEFIKILNLPLVIKPNFEGSSIGITNSNLVYNFNEAITLTKKLLTTFKQPILVEEFIGGKEVNVIIAGDNKNINLFEMVEDIMIDDENYFNKNLFSLENKKIYRKSFTHNIVTNLLSKDEINNLKKIYQSLKKIDYMRIDGKFINNKFIFLELTSDPHLGIESSFVFALKQNNFTYEEGIKFLIDNCIKYYQTQSSNVLNY